MKLRLSALTFALLFISFGCQDFTEQLGAEPTLPPPPPQEYNNPSNPGTPLPTALKVTSYSALSTDLQPAVSQINSNPSMYWGTLDNGQRYTNFSASSSWPNQALYLKRVNIVEPPADYVTMTEAEFKAFVNNELPKLGMSSAFNTFVNNTVWWMYEYLMSSTRTVYFTSSGFWDTKFKDYCVSRMSLVKGSGSLSEFEKFVLTQMYNGLLVQVEHAYNNPSPTLHSSGCLPQTKEEWKAVAESAFTTGLMSGIRIGIQGARAGAIATTAAGNPVAGGIIGGGIGFTIGFLGGAFIGGGGKMMVSCIWNKVAGQMMTFQCGDKVYSAWTASPPSGCTEIPSNSIAPSIKVALTSIYEYGVVPKSGYSGIDPSVTTNINDFIKYLNQ